MIDAQRKGLVGHCDHACTTSTHKADCRVSIQRVVEQQEHLRGHAVTLAQGPVAHKANGNHASGIPNVP
jgi:hypothetical protein